MGPKKRKLNDIVEQQSHVTEDSISVDIKQEDSFKFEQPALDSFCFAAKNDSEEPALESKGPKNWEIMYEKINQFRLLNTAEVDTMGCATLADGNSDQPTFRYHILTSLQLSSQTKDPITAQAIKNLQNHPNGLTPASISQMDEKELNNMISKVGFHNRKTKYMKDTARILIEKYNSDIPESLEDLLSLPGIGPKMAYLILQEAWGKNLGIGVDTHVHRISNRLGWVKTKTPEDTRKELEDWLPKHYWAHVNVMLVGFGQVLCKPVAPRCQNCPLKDLCPKIGTKTKSSK
jgi:endonuclease-3